MKKLIILLFVFILSSQGYSQTKVSGTVLNSEKEPLVGASVYFNNTSIGAVTDSEGYFQLHIGIGKHDLIVSYIGYHTLQYNLETTGKNESLILNLLPKNNILDEIVIHSKKKQLNKHDYRKFKNAFLGKTKLSRQCKILNPEVLEFYTEENTKTFTVETKAPIQIEHKGLGYKITYDLMYFTLTDERIEYFGYSKFENLKGKKRKWEKNRLKAYKGSQTHFIHSLQKANTREEGFIINQFKRVLKPNFPTHEEITQANIVIKSNRKRGLIEHHLKQDANTNLNQARLILKKSREEKFTPVNLKNDINYSDIVFMMNRKIFLKFDYNLEIIYTKEKEEANYRPNKARVSQQSSVFTLLADQVRIFPNGQIENPLEVLVENYWGYKQFADALPLDYKPTKD
jgi:hypothetical protein